LFFTSVSFAQSSGDCIDCSKLQSRADSITAAKAAQLNLYAEIEKKVSVLGERIEAGNEIRPDSAQAVQNQYDLLRNQLRIENRKLEGIERLETAVILKLDSCQSAKVLQEASNENSCSTCVNGKKVFTDGAFCDDGDPCTKNDRCVNGICIGDPVTSNENPECAGGGKN
jgi:hypothetical protein